MAKRETKELSIEELEEHAWRAVVGAKIALEELRRRRNESQSKIDTESDNPTPGNSGS